MSVPAKEALDKTREGKHTTRQFNINNLEWTKSVLLIMEELKSPAILGASEGVGRYTTGFKTVAAMVEVMMEELNITVPVALHSDHGLYEGCYKCTKTGFPFIMFDGSRYPIEENIEKTKELVKTAHTMGLSLGAEVDSIGGEENGVVGLGECADPNECKAIADLGINFLAASVGNIHGKYPANWLGLRFDVLESAKEKVGDMPLALHDGTGISENVIKKATSLGIAKINVNTGYQLTFAVVTREYIEADENQQDKGFDLRRLLVPGVDAIKTTVEKEMELFGSVGEAQRHGSRQILRQLNKAH